jgi:hypothetical protein
MLDRNFLVENNLNDQLVMMMVMMIVLVEYKNYYPKIIFFNFEEILRKNLPM